ncbi:MAG: hypothetical protein LAT82_01360 [Nanoarchaeota archaeon]|nr:hypothetical protein [Nanoarchaeota archaeon]
MKSKCVKSLKERSLKGILRSTIFPIILMPTNLGSLETEISYCGYTYDSLLNQFKYEVEDAELINNENYFIAYNPDNLGIGIIEHSTQMYIVYGRDNSFSSESPTLLVPEICPVLEEVFSSGRFHN